MKRTTRSSCSRNKEPSSSDLNITDQNGKLPAKRSRLHANRITHANGASASSSSSSTSTQKRSNSSGNDNENESDVFMNDNQKCKEKDEEEIDANGLIKNEANGPVCRNKQKQNDSGQLENQDINSEPESDDSDGENSILSSSAPSTPENMPRLNFPGEESDNESNEEYDSEATEIASSYESNSEQLDLMDEEISNQSTIIMSPLEEEEEEEEEEEVEHKEVEQKEEDKKEGKNTEQEGLRANKSSIEQNQDQIETNFTNHNNSTAHVSIPMISSVMISQTEQQNQNIQKTEPPQPEPEPGQLDLEQSDLEQSDLEQPEPGQPGPEQPVPKLPQTQLNIRDILNPTEITFMRCGVCLDLFSKLNDLTNHMQSSHSNYQTYCLFTRKGTFDSDEQEDKPAEVVSRTNNVLGTTKQPIQPIPTIPVPTGDPVPTRDSESTAVSLFTGVSIESTEQNAPNPTPTNHNYTTLSLQCRVDKCPAFMANEDELASHMNQSHKLDQFECYVAGCSAVFLSQADYQRHIDVNSAAHKSYVCCVCSITFATYHRLAQHYNITHEFGVFQCECGYMAESRIKMLTHQYMRTRN